MPTPVALREVSKVFPGPAGAAATAVDRVTLDIAPGELFFLLGPSGCGKTTILRMIAGFVEATEGRVEFNGADVTRVPPNRRNTGMVFQSYALWPHMSVEANVAFGLGVGGRRTPRAERARRVAEALDAVRMREYAARMPAQLSGGQQQRVALARALVIRPDVLLLDEPLANLDAKLRVELRAEIRRICKDAGITTVYVTHDQKEALSMADRVAIIDRGRLAQLGAPRDLYRRPVTRFVAEFLGETNFIEGTIAERAPGRTVVETPIGRLVSSTPPPAPSTTPADSRVLCSIRPEALSAITTGPGSVNTLHGRVSSTMFLGELSHADVQVAPGHHLRVAWLGTRAGDGEALELSVSPDDVVLLPP